MRKTLYLLLLSIVALIGCRPTDYTVDGPNCRFNIAVENYDGYEPAKAELQQITALKAAIYDDKGALVKKQVSISYANDLKQIDVEGLRDGNYTIAFFAVGEVRTPVTITTPTTLGGAWIPQTPGVDTLYNEYLWASTPFVMSGGACETKTVTLSHIVSKIRVNVDATYPNWPGGYIRNIELAFDNNTFASNHSASGQYLSPTKQSFSTTVDYSDLYLLPASGADKVRGVATIVGTYSNGSECRVVREFSLSIVANKIQTLNVNFEDADADNLGLVRLFDSDRPSHTIHKVWQDGCAKSEYMNNQRFYPTKPLQLSIDTKDKRLISTLYGGVALRDVTVLVRRTIDAEFFELAWFESVGAFEQRTIDFSANLSPKLYRTESGKMIMIDGIKSLDNVQIKYRSEDPFIKKIQTITWPGYIIFNSSAIVCDPGTDPPDTGNNTKNQSVAVRPVYAREAMAMYTNVGYTLSQQRWRDKMLESEKDGMFTNDGKNPTSFTNDILPRITRTTNLSVAIINPRWNYTLNGVANVGNGDYFSLREYVLIYHYTDWDRPNTFYHEYCHTLGFGHEGNMTYGKFCEITAKFHISIMSEMPYNSGAILHSWDNKSRYGG